MAFLAAVLLLNMEETDAFICFSNLINRPMQMAFFSVDQPMVINGFLTVRNFLRVAFNHPKVFRVFYGNIYGASLQFWRNLHLAQMLKRWPNIYHNIAQTLFLDSVHLTCTMA